MRAVLRWVRAELRKRDVEISRVPFPDANALDILTILAEREASQSDEFVVLQIGANDGRTGDPVNGAINRFGWRAVCVEPLPTAFQRLCETYSDAPQVTCVNCAIAREDGTLTLYTVREDGSAGDPVDLVASFSREVLLEQKHRIPDLERRIVAVEVPALSIRSLLRRHSIDSVGLLQIDTEGFDFEVVKMALAAGLQPPIINFENKHLSAEDRRACSALLGTHGYRTASIGDDTVAYRNIEARVAVRARAA